MVAGCSPCKLFVIVASKLDPKNGNGCACAPHTTTRTYSLPDPFPKTGEMHANKRGGPAIKTATRPRTMNRNSRTSMPRNSREELEYQGFRLRQVTFHGERSRLPRNSGAPHNGSGDGDMQGSLDLVDLGCRLFPHASFLSLLPQSLTQKPATDAHARPTPALARTLSQTHSQKREKCMPIKGAAPL